MIVTALNYLLFSWLFWPFLVAALFIPHFVVKESKDFVLSPIIPFGIAFGALWCRWPTAFSLTWGGAAIAVIVYLVLGGVYSALKYIGMLRRFQADVQRVLSSCTELEKVDRINRVACNLGQWLSGYRQQYEWDGDVFKLRWITFPIANWWIWWPWFLCGTLFDFVANLGDRLVAPFKGFYQRLSDRFSVKL